MPRFYLHFEDADSIARDSEGFEAADVQAARRVGMRAAGDIAAEAMAGGETVVCFRLSLDDEAGREIAVLPVSVSVGPGK